MVLCIGLGTKSNWWCLSLFLSIFRLTSAVHGRVPRVHSCKVHTGRHTSRHMGVWPKFEYTHGLVHDWTQPCRFLVQVQWSHGLIHGRVTQFWSCTRFDTRSSARSCVPFSSMHTCWHTALCPCFQIFPIFS